MKTDFHKKLESMCKISRRGDQHWIPEGPLLVRVPLKGGEVFTLKRAIYAAFVGKVPAGREPRTTCGLSACCAPTHLALFDSRSKARELDLQPELDALADKRRGLVKTLPGALPKHITGAKAEMVRVLSTMGSSMGSIRAKTGLSAMDVIRIRAGYYDEAIKKDVSRSKAVSTEPPVVQEQNKVVSEPLPEMSEEERMWLETMNK